MSAFSHDELVHIAQSVEPIRGWDFSRAGTSIDPVPWEYREVVHKFLSPEHHVLDIATGGGEVFMTLAPNFRSGVGVDSEPVMIQTAEENARAKSILNLSFEVMTAQDLTFPTARFDVVLNRHGPVFPNEIVPVLRSGGVFITHQVGGRNFQSIFDTFDFGFRSNGDYWQDYWKRHSIEAQDQSSLIASFEALGCRIVVRGEYDVPYYFTNVESLMFFLQAIPLPEDFDIDRHWKRVQALIETHETSRGIRTNEHRELLVIERPRASV